MAKIIAVTGATGGQGGSVAQNLLKKPEWKVRAITRNVNSKGAQALAAQGAEVVAANLDDEASLVKAFEVHITFHAFFSSALLRLRLNIHHSTRAPTPSSA